MMARPAGDPRAWVVFVHGLAAEATEGGLFSDCMERLRHVGIASVSYDWRGLGLSQGDFVAAPLEQHVEDFRTVLASVMAKAFATRTAVHVVGFSLGCAVATIGLDPTLGIASCVFLSPALRPRRSMWPRYNTEPCRRQLEHTGILVKAENGIRIGRRLIENLQHLDLHDSALSRPWPFLICHGTADQRIPISETTDLLRRHTTARVSFEKFPGASHSFRPEERFRERLYGRITRWLEGEFQAAKRPKTRTRPAAHQPETEPVLV